MTDKPDTVSSTTFGAMTDKAQESTTAPTSTTVVPPASANERMESVDSAAFFEGDEYDDYDDFQASNAAGGGGGGRTKSTKMNRRQDNRGGSGGSGTIYSAKHVRAKEAIQKGK